MRHDDTALVCAWTIAIFILASGLSTASFGDHFNEADHVSRGDTVLDPAANNDDGLTCDNRQRRGGGDRRHGAAHCGADTSPAASTLSQEILWAARSSGLTALEQYLINASEVQTDVLPPEHPGTDVCGADSVPATTSPPTTAAAHGGPTPTSPPTAAGGPLTSSSPTATSTTVDADTAAQADLAFGYGITAFFGDQPARPDRLWRGRASCFGAHLWQARRRGCHLDFMRHFVP